MSPYHHYRSSQRRYIQAYHTALFVNDLEWPSSSFYCSVSKIRLLLWYPVTFLQTLDFTHFRLLRHNKCAVNQKWWQQQTPDAVHRTWPSTSQKTTSISQTTFHHHTPHHNRFMALFLGTPSWTNKKRELLDFMVQGRLTQADTPIIRLGATPSGLSSAHLHHPPIFLQAGCPSCRPANSVKALKATNYKLHFNGHNIVTLSFEIQGFPY